MKNTKIIHWKVYYKSEFWKRYWCVTSAGKRIYACQYQDTDCWFYFPTQAEMRNFLRYYDSRLTRKFREEIFRVFHRYSYEVQVQGVKLTDYSMMIR